MALPSTGKGRGSPASSRSISRLWAASRAVYTTRRAERCPRPAGGQILPGDGSGQFILHDMDLLYSSAVARRVTWQLTLTATGSPATWVGAVSMDSPRQVVCPPKPWGPTPRALIASSSPLLQLGVEGVGVGLVDGPEQGVLGQIGHLVESCRRCRCPARWGGRGWSRPDAPVSMTKFFTPSTPSAGLSMPRRLMFSLPKPLGATVMSTPVPRNQADGDGGGGVVLGVYPAQGSPTMDLRRYPSP